MILGEVRKGFGELISRLDTEREDRKKALEEMKEKNRRREIIMERKLEQLDKKIENVKKISKGY